MRKASRTGPNRQALLGESENVTLTARDLFHVLRGAVLGGFLVLFSLVGLVYAFVQVAGNGPERNLFLGAIAFVLCVLGLLGALRVIGLWGHWGLLVFFATAPILLIVDHAINPFFPAGTLVCAVLLGGYKFGKARNGR